MDNIPEYISYTINKDGQIKYRIDRPLLAKYIRSNYHYLFVRSNVKSGVNRYWYNNGVYKMASDDDIRGYIKQVIIDFDESLARWSVITEVFMLLTCDNNYIDESDLNTNEDVINFQNGLYNIKTNILLPHTPHLYSTIQLPCNYIEVNDEATVFNNYLKTLTNGDEQKARLILQFMGVALSNIKGNRFKKALFLIGDGNSGKSQIRKLMELLLGKDNCSAQDIFQLEKRFGSSSICGKRLMGSADMSFRNLNELAVFKRLTGGDTISGEYKHENGFDFVYNGLIWCCGNEMPTFSGDQGEWVYDRMIIIECNNVIAPEKQDKHLLDKMMLEAPAIISMELNALKDVMVDYRFDIPDSCAKILDTYKSDNDIVRKFYAECCIPRQPGRYSTGTTKDIYNYFLCWCNENYSGAIVKKSEFNSRLCKLLKITKQELIKRQNDNTYYCFDIKKV